MTKKLQHLNRFNWVTLLCLLPIVLIGLLIITQTINIPFMDQWETLPMFQHLQLGHLVWTDFWWQHNEHRVLIPNIILTASAMLTHWNLIVECFISLGLAIASYGLLLKIIQNSSLNLKRSSPVWLPVVLSLIWFSPVQVENWLWGWQVGWFLNVLGVVLVALAISRVKQKNLSRNQTLLILTGALLAQYSVGNGTLLWPIILAILIYQRVSSLKIATIAGTGLISTMLYYHHYVNPTYPSKTLFIKQPIVFIRYVLIYLGRPITFLHTGGPIMGAILLATFIGLYVYLFMHKRKTFDQLMPWLLFGLYAISSALVTAMSRMGLGLSQAYSSRYTTIAMLLLISTGVSLVFAFRDLPSRVMQHRWRKIIIVVGSLGISVLLLTNMAFGIHAALRHKREITAIANCTKETAPSPTCLLSTYPFINIIRQRLDYLKQIHWGGY